MIPFSKTKQTKKPQTNKTKPTTKKPTEETAVSIHPSRLHFISGGYKCPDSFAALKTQAMR